MPPPRSSAEGSMATATNIVPIRIEASSADNGSRFRIIDTLLIDTTCLPIQHVDVAPQTCSDSSSSSPAAPSEYSLSALIERNAAYLTESILADAEVYGAAKSSKHYLGGRLDLLSDTQLYKTINEQINTQLNIALTVGKNELLCGQSGDGEGLSVNLKAESSGVAPDVQSGTENAEENINKTPGHRPHIVRIKLRLRQEQIVVVDEFDYDASLSGLAGSDPFSIAKSMVKDLHLPREFEVSIASSIIEQIYGIDVPESLDGVMAGVSRDVPGAYALNVTQEGSSAGFSQMILDS